MYETLVVPVSSAPAQPEPAVAETTPTNWAVHAESLPELLADSAGRWPDRLALTGCEPELTYRQLADHVTGLARYLRSSGVRPGDRIGLSVERGPLSLIASAAIMRSGCAYVPLPPGQPPARLDRIASGAGLTAAVCDAAGSAQLAALRLRPIEISYAELVEHHVVPDASEELPFPARADAAYVLYTSGSTGAPKGVEITHRNVMALLGGALDWFDIGQDEAWPMTHGDGFDVSVWERWAAIATGSTLICTSDEAILDPTCFADLLLRHRATRLHIVPSIFGQLVDTIDEVGQRVPLRNVTFCGEPVRYPDMARWAGLHADAPPRWFNVYGITETTVYNTLAHITAEVIAEAPTATPIGRPYPDSPMLVLDESQRERPRGEVGEIYIGGAQLSAGYVGDPALTAMRFVPVPGHSGLWYRTGDLGHTDDEGCLHYVGRADDQVKIRGIRVELGEIDHALRALPWIGTAAAVASQNSVGDYVLSAGVVLRSPDDDRDPLALQQRLAHDLKPLLPAPLVPTRIICLAQMPLNASGKTDRRALAALVAG